MLFAQTFMFTIPIASVHAGDLLPCFVRVSMQTDRSKPSAQLHTGEIELPKCWQTAKRNMADFSSLVTGKKKDSLL